MTLKKREFTSESGSVDTYEQIQLQHNTYIVLSMRLYLSLNLFKQRHDRNTVGRLY